MKRNQLSTRAGAPLLAALILLSGCATPAEEPSAAPVAAVQAVVEAPSDPGPAPLEMLAAADRKAAEKAAMIEAEIRAAAEKKAAEKEAAEEATKRTEEAAAAEAERVAAEQRTALQEAVAEPVAAPPVAPAPVVAQPASWHVPVVSAGGQDQIDRCIGPIHFTPLSGYGVYITEHDFCGGWARFSGMNVGETVTVAGIGTYTVKGVGTVPQGGSTADVVGQFGCHPAVVLQTCIPGTSSMRVIALG